MTGRLSLPRMRHPWSIRLAIVLIAVVSAGAAALGGCRSLYGPPMEGLRTKVVRAKREPDQLIAQDLTVCWVIPEVFAGIKPGDHWRCDWRRIPRGM